MRIQGVWEGNLARYDADGRLQSRQPTVLFIYPSSPVDEAKIARGEVPSHLNLRLHRVTEGRDVDKSYMNEPGDFASAVFHAVSGNYAQGFESLNPAAVSVFEFGINHSDADGKIRGRARLLSVFSTEHLTRFSVFRERPGNHAVDTPSPVVPDEVRDSDTVSSTTDVNAAILCGTWRVETLRFGVTEEKRVAVQTSATESRAMDGRHMTIDRDGIKGVGEVSEDGRSMVMQFDGCAERRLLFLNGGITVMHSLLIPKGNEDFYVELAWLVEPDLRYVTGRRHIGMGWVDSSFSIERRQ